MASSSKKVNVGAQMKKLIDPKVNNIIRQVRDESYKEGKIEGYTDVLGWLEKKYLTDEDRPDRNSPEAKAILELAREIAAMVRGELEK